MAFITTLGLKMSFEIFYTQIPEHVTDNFTSTCGRHTDILEDNYNTNRDNLLKEFKCSRVFDTNDKLVYRFKSRAHYDWFLLRWSE